MQVKIYTDGAARGNPDGPGGYGAVLQIPKASYMNVNCPEATKKPQTTGWN